MKQKENIKAEFFMITTISSILLFSSFNSAPLLLINSFSIAHLFSYVFFYSFSLFCFKNNSSMKEYKLRVDQYRVFFFGFDFSEFDEFDNEVMNVLRKMKEIFYFFWGKKNEGDENETKREICLSLCLLMTMMKIMVVEKMKDIKGKIKKDFFLYTFLIYFL